MDVNIETNASLYTKARKNANSTKKDTVGLGKTVGTTIHQKKHIGAQDRQQDGIPSQQYITNHIMEASPHKENMEAMTEDGKQTHSWQEMKTLFYY